MWWTCLSKTNCGFRLSPRRLWTLPRPSRIPKLNRGSSLKITEFHSWFHNYRSLQDSNRLRRCSAVWGNRSENFQFDKKMVHIKTLLPCSINHWFAIDLGVLSFCIPVPLTLYAPWSDAWQHLATVYWLLYTLSAISRIESAGSRNPTIRPLLNSLTGR